MQNVEKIFAKMNDREFFNRPYKDKLFLHKHKFPDELIGEFMDFLKN